jgi:hypothetical protein
MDRYRYNMGPKSKEPRGKPRGIEEHESRRSENKAEASFGVSDPVRMTNSGWRADCTYAFGLSAALVGDPKSVGPHRRRPGGAF